MPTDWGIRGGRRAVHRAGPAQLGLAFAALWAGASAVAAGPVACVGAVAAGSAVLSCSHGERSGAPQLCTFGWTLTAPTTGVRTYRGSFLIWPGQKGTQVFLTSGVAAALGEPVVLCRAAAPKR